MQDSYCRRFATLFHTDSDSSHVSSEPLNPRIGTLMAEVEIHGSDRNADNFRLRSPNFLNTLMKVFSDDNFIVVF